MEQFNQIDSLVAQVKGNASFLRKVFFGRHTAVVAVVVGFFLIAAVVVK